jgi:hypothetical protein
VEFQTRSREPSEARAGWRRMEPTSGSGAQPDSQAAAPAGMPKAGGPHGPLERRTFLALNGPFGAARDGRIGVAAPDDAGLGPGIGAE